MKAVADITGEKARRADRIERPRLRSFLEHKCSVADDSVPGPGRVTGIAQIEGARAQPMAACGLQEPANGHPTARALLANVAGLQGLDALAVPCRGLVDVSGDRRAPDTSTR